MKHRHRESRPKPPESIFQWIEIAYRCMVDRRFRATRYKRKLYFKHCMVRSWRSLF